MYKTLLISGLVTLLSACGGGGAADGLTPSISEIRAQSLKYSQTTTIYVAGKYLRSDMVASTGSCTNPSFSSQSTTDVAILNCKVTATGPLPITISSSSGQTLYATTLNVAQPEVTLLVGQDAITMELYPDKVPLTVNNFLSYVNSGYYAKTLFHRVITGFVVQGGGLTTGLVPKTGERAPIALETNKGLSNLRGTVAMARNTAPNSATNQFFINVVDNTALDYQDESNPGYAVFGKVTSDMSVIDTIAAVPTGPNGLFSDVPLTDVVIQLALQTK